MPLLSLIELIVLASIWGASFIFMRIAAPELGAPLLIFLRVGLAGLMLLPLLAKARYRAELKTHGKILALLGVINSAIPFTLLAFSSISLQAGFTSILNATVPFFGIMISYLVLREKVTRAQFMGLVLGFIGVFILIGFKATAWTRDEIIATATALAAALMYAIAAPLTKKHLKGVSSIAFVIGTQLSAAVALLPLLPFTYQEPAAITWPLVGSVVTLGFVCSGIAYILYYRLIHTIGPTKTLTVTYLMPIAAMIWGALILGEAITINMALGCGLILVGTAVANEMISLSKKSSSKI